VSLFASHAGIWGLDLQGPTGYYIIMKYAICISAKAKDKVDQWRLQTDTGRFPYRLLVHKSYKDNRPLGALRSEALSIRMRPVVVQTNVADEKIIELLELVDMLDVMGRYATTDGKMVTHFLGTLIDAVIMGDLIDTNELPLDGALPFDPDPYPGQTRLNPDQVSRHNLGRLNAHVSA
jgi:hypothetical protein